MLRDLPTSDASATLRYSSLGEHSTQALGGVNPDCTELLGFTCFLQCGQSNGRSETKSETFEAVEVWTNRFDNASLLCCKEHTNRSGNSQAERCCNTTRLAIQGAVIERPDWIAEILSTSTADRDLNEKLASYHAAGIPHYWILDPANRILMIYRHSADGYIFVRGANAGTILHPEPFNALELSVGFLFGEEDEEEQRATENP